MYFLHGNLTSKPGFGLQLADILTKASELVSNAKGCRLYVVCNDSKKPDAIWITEIWDSKEDHDVSLSVPGVRELISEALPLLLGPPKKGQELTMLGGFLPKLI
jgi:quinol monooxygenase YgiN